MREIIERTEIIQTVEPHIEGRIDTPILLQVAQLVHVLHVHAREHVDHGLVGHVLGLGLVAVGREVGSVVVLGVVMAVAVVILAGVHVVFLVPGLALVVIVTG